MNAHLKAHHWEFRRGKEQAGSKSDFPPTPYTTPQDADPLTLATSSAVLAGAPPSLVLAWRRMWEPNFPFGQEEGHPCMGGPA